MSEEVGDKKTLDFSTCSELQVHRDLIISVLIGLSKKQFRSLWEDMANAVPVAQLAQTLSSWVQESAKKVLPQAMMEVQLRTDTPHVSMSVSPELLNPTSLKMDHQALHTESPSTFSISACKSPLRRPNSLPSLRRDAWCHSISTTSSDGDKNSMGDSWRSTQIDVAPADPRLTQSNPGAAQETMLRATVSEHSVTSSGQLSVAIGSASARHYLEGITPEIDTFEEVAYSGATGKMSSYIHTGNLACGTQQPVTSSVEHPCVDGGSWCVSSKSRAMDALKNAMERMVLCVDNVRVSQERLEALLSSRLLQPFIQDLVDQLQQVISVKNTAASLKSEGSAIYPEVSLNRRITMDRCLDITWAYTQKVVRSLLRELLFSLHSPYIDNDKRVNFGVCSSQMSLCPTTKICTEVVKVFTEGLVQKVTALQSKNNATCLSSSVSTVSLQSHSSLGSGSTCMSSVPPYILGLRFEGEDYQSLITILVVKLILDIHQPKDEEYFVSIPTLSRMLINRVLYEFCGMSGLSKNEAYPPTLTMKKIYRNVYRKLLAEFGTTEELQKALFSQRVSFSMNLVSHLCEELLKQCRRERSAHLAISTKTAMTTASTKIVFGKERETKVSTRASSFFKGRRASQKTNKGGPKLVLAHQKSSRPADNHSRDMKECNGCMMEDTHIDNSGSGDRSHDHTMSEDISSNPTLFSWGFNRLSAVRETS